MYNEIKSYMKLDLFYKVLDIIFKGAILFVLYNLCY